LAGASLASASARPAAGRDAGVGFPERFAERAFERFSRAEESRTTSGAGLWLAIVAAVAEAHGGSATLGDGAVVSIRVPSGPRPEVVAAVKPGAEKELVAGRSS
jgi:K+-sensing histidine kinase KdpD